MTEENTIVITIKLEGEEFIFHAEGKLSLKSLAPTLMRYLAGKMGG